MHVVVPFSYARVLTNASERKKALLTITLRVVYAMQSKEKNWRLTLQKSLLWSVIFTFHTVWSFQLDLKTKAYLSSNPCCSTTLRGCLMNIGLGRRRRSGGNRVCLLIDDVICTLEVRGPVVPLYLDKQTPNVAFSSLPDIPDPVMAEPTASKSPGAQSIAVRPATKLFWPRGVEGELS